MTQFIIYPDTMAVRAFKNPDLAYMWARGNEDIIYTTPYELRRLSSEFKEYWGAYDPELLWDILKNEADWVEEPPSWVKQTEEGKKQKVYHIDLDRAKLALEHNDMRIKQLKALVQLLINEDAMLLTEEEVKALVTSSKFYKLAKTKQDPWRIFRYYRQWLVEYDVIRIK